MNALQVGIGGSGYDPRLQEIANKFPDPSKSQGLAITALEVKPLAGTWITILGVQRIFYTIIGKADSRRWIYARFSFPTHRGKRETKAV